MNPLLRCAAKKTQKQLPQHQSGIIATAFQFTELQGPMQVGAHVVNQGI
jgi:hypothetical protein